MAPLPLVMLHGAVGLVGLDLALKGACPLAQKSFGLSEDLCVSNSATFFPINLASQQPNFAVPCNVHVAIQTETKSLIGNLVSTVIIGALGAYLWQSKVTQKKIDDKDTTLEKALQGKKTKMAETGEWQYGLFGCFDNWNYCIHGLCCYPCMAADLFSVNVEESYWKIWFLVMLPQILSPIVSIVSFKLQPPADCLALQQKNQMQACVAYPLGIFIAFALTGPTGKLREKLGGQKSFMNDFMTWWCCPCCSVIQKQREVDELRKDKLVGCMNVETNVTAREVGDAFGVTPNEPLLA